VDVKVSCSQIPRRAFAGIRTHDPLVGESDILTIRPRRSCCLFGNNKIWNKAKADGYKINRPEVRAFLENQPTYSLHKPIMKKIPFRKIMLSYVDQHWQADLVYMQRFENNNCGYRFTSLL
jgi:hypothetical protein